MPDDFGKLSDDERQHVANWFAEKTALVGKCPLCGTREWTVLSHLMQAPVTTLNTYYLFAGLCCSNCGNTHLIAADDIGLVDKEEAYDAELSPVTWGRKK